MALPAFGLLWLRAAFAVGRSKLAGELCTRQGGPPTSMDKLVRPISLSDTTGQQLRSTDQLCYRSIPLLLSSLGPVAIDARPCVRCSLVASSTLTLRLACDPTASRPSVRTRVPFQTYSILSAR